MLFNNQTSLCVWHTKDINFWNGQHSLKQTIEVLTPLLTHNQKHRTFCLKSTWMHTHLGCYVATVESTVHSFQKQQTLQRLCAESLNSCFSDVSLTVLSSFVSRFLCFFSLSFSAWAAESAHQINTERGIVFRLETAEQVTDNGNMWMCTNCGCKKKAIPMQISVGALWNHIWFWNLITPPNCFPGKKTTTGFSWNDQYSRLCIPHLPETWNTSGWGIIMKPISSPPNVIIIIRKPRRVGDIGEGLETRRSFLGLRRFQSFGSGLSGAVGKTQSHGRNRNTGPKDCSVWPEVQTIDSQQFLSEPTTNPTIL